MNYKFLKVYAKSRNPFHFSNEQNRPVFQRHGSRKHVFVEDIERALVITENMNLKETIQYFNMLGVDYLRVCKYHKFVSQLKHNYHITIDEP
jgi:hypothetical protein